MGLCWVFRSAAADLLSAGGPILFAVPPNFPTLAQRDFQEMQILHGPAPDLEWI